MEPLARTSRLSPTPPPPPLGAHPRAPMLPPPAGVRGRVFVNRDRCKGCELCIEFCPKRVLARSQGFNAKGYHYPVASSNGCINCRLCVTVCPEYAIFSVPAAPAIAAAATQPGGSA